ncbi:DUF6498-containing protein [Parahaliea aestuarii]|uniref:Uncharacterized protein n=1 Tax=Parahaliea aestuarii TaxID=1852021 RepID=A0A5C8ZTK1_9GAMM|nr:DUF6498-containing protein [Parahaliea aestuarii]TXS90892.1 hypothetical protein FVW59_11775 [Parahaliea aestuarii]
MTDMTGHSQSLYAGLRRQASLLLLILANLLPLYGVLLLDWDVGALLVLYWSENLVLGFYTVLKMLITAPLGGLFSACFFSVHYGGFCAVHGLFILKILIDPEADFFRGEQWPFFLVFIQLLVDVVRQVLEHAPAAWLLAFAGLMLSHGVSFVMNFLLARERDQLGIKVLMFAPYGRIVILHLTVLFGGFGVMALGEPLSMLVILILLKLGVDIALHLREHRHTALREPVTYRPFRELQKIRQ